MRRHFHFAASLAAAAALTVAATLGGAGCLGDRPASTPTGDDTLDPATQETSAAAGPDNTFDHEMDQRDPFEILKQRQEEGAPEVSVRMHSCKKISYETLGRILASRGVKLDARAAAGQPPTAGDLYRGGAQALGAPNYAGRVPEAVELTTASATKLFDIFVQAAPEIIAAMPTLPACTVDGQGARMFDDGGRCTLEGISCLQGAPATSQHVELCNQLVASASTDKIGRSMAVGAILAAAHTCE